MSKIFLKKFEKPEGFCQIPSFVYNERGEKGGDET